MDIQLIIVILLFIAAAIYIGRMIFRSINIKKSECGGSCKCGVDFNNPPPTQK